MRIEDVKRNLGNVVEYKGGAGIYMLTGCILRKGENGIFYQAEILDVVSGNSVIICKLEEIEVME